MSLNGLPPIDRARPVLIAGATASGKSELALRIAATQGGVIANAAASQGYDCWQVITARPGAADLARAPHALYGHVGWRRAYSAGDWLREVRPLLHGPERPIIVGGTGLFFEALTRGLVEIPPVPAQVRAEADALPLDALLADLDASTLARIDPRNRARVQRAWEVLRATGRGLALWQDDTPAPDLRLDDAHAIVLDAPKDWLEPRIARRLDAMLAGGAAEEVAAMRPHYTPALPAFRAIGVPELVDYADGLCERDETRRRIIVSTRQFAKRQRTWFRSKMRQWQRIGLPSPEGDLT